MKLVLQKLMEEIEGSKAEDSKEETTSVVIEEVPPRQSEYIIRHASRGKTD